MKSSWMGIGFSHHSVPSLSNTATRCSTGTGGEPSAPVTRATKSTTACRAGPARQLVSAGGVLGRGRVVMTPTLRPRPHPGITRDGGRSGVAAARSGLDQAQFPGADDHLLAVV